MRRTATLVLLLCVILAALSAPMQAAQAPPDQSTVLEAGRADPLPDGWPTDAQSTTGPAPPEGTDMGDQGHLAPEAEVVISGVPAYTWYRGCGPTAAGMVIGYWDGQGFDNLVSGSAATQTATVEAMISSSGNWDDYCLPLDYSPDPIQPDKSEPPVGDEHPDDCVADLMKTSQSYHGNYYGWSWFSHVDDALRDYVTMAAPEYATTVTNQYWGTFTWNSFRAEIDAGRPVVLLVDTDGNGGTDHFVTAIGYSDATGTNRYACLNTWDTDIHWYEFAQMAPGQPWGIYGATLFDISGAVGPLAYHSRTIDDDNSGQSSGDGDGIADCGEDIELYVDLLNQGGTTVTGVSATISTVDPYVGFTYNTTSDYLDIPGGAVQTNSNDFDLSVSPTTPHGHAVHFDLSITAANGGPWSSSFDMPVICGTGDRRVFLPAVFRQFQPGFVSLFNGSAPGWEPHAGAWWIDSGAWYTTHGLPSAVASASHVGDYDDFDYQASVWRIGCETCAHGLMVRGVPEPFGDGYRWYKGYAFYIARDRYYLVLEYDSGTSTVLQPWTYSSAIVPGSDWNDLRVVADGTNMHFYINGTHVWSGSDSSFSSGRVGLLLYRDTDSTGNQFWADWAVLSPLASSFAAAGISPEQLALNEAAGSERAGESSVIEKR